MTVGALPNMIITGAMKAGTTSLHNYLSLHSEIEMSAVKELDFFIRPEAERDLEWLRRQFTGGTPVRGYSSPRYTNRPETEGLAGAIRDALGEIQLIYLIRDPVERAISHWIHLAAREIEERPIDEALSDFSSTYVQSSRYMFQLEPLIEAFGRERVLVLSSDELLASRRATLVRVFEFLGVNPGFDSPLIDREWETKSQKTRRLTVARNWAKRSGFSHVWSRLPTRFRWEVTRALGSGRPVPQPQLADEVRESLERYLAPELEAARALAGSSAAISP